MGALVHLLWSFLGFVLAYAEPARNSQCLAEIRQPEDNSDVAAFIQIETKFQVKSVHLAKEGRQKTTLPLVPAPHRIDQPAEAPMIVESLVVEPTDPGQRELVAKVAYGAAHLYNLTGSVALQVDASPGLESTAVKVTMRPPQGSGDEERYVLKTSSGGQGVEIEASTARGIFNGLLTLRQLLVRDGSKWHLPSVTVEDAPATEWRGMMLDCARSFFPPEVVKQFISTMALFKFNRFHWHLTDDQGWRFPVEKWPELVTRGAWRDGSPNTQRETFAHRHDHVRHGGAYTEADIQEVVNHAAALFIEVVPEVDIPGHAQAAIAAYPELGNTDVEGWQAPDVADIFGPQQYTLGASESAFRFVRDVVDAEAKLVPSRYVHLGGDEVIFKQWVASPSAQRFMQSMSGNYTHQEKAGPLQGYFQNMGVKQAQKNGRRPIVWEEAAAEGKNLSTDAIVMVWDVKHAGFHGRFDSLTSRGYDVILAPLHYTYLDFAETKYDGDYVNPYGRTVVPFTEAFKLPIYTSRGPGRVLGGQAQVWTEYIRSKEHVDYNTWPRGAAIAERLWEGGTSPGDDIENLQARLKLRLAEMDHMGVHYRPF
mmetsp:Transcript_9203/g.20518  ORF Transcript_9203/g.20518 Transcript_9203/m.20518 type:complete len:594 (+) Transcript_9203:114-1895(+)